MKKITVGDFAEPEEPIGTVVYRFLKEEIITERNTDTIIEVVTRFLPGWLAFFAKRALDFLLPEKALEAITLLFARLGIIPPKRQRQPSDPFREHPWEND